MSCPEICKHISAYARSDVAEQALQLCTKSFCHPHVQSGAQWWWGVFTGAFVFAILALVTIIAVLLVVQRPAPSAPPDYAPEKKVENPEPCIVVEEV